MGKLEVINPPMKELKQQELLMVEVEVMRPPMNRLEQEKLLMVKLEVISPPMKRPSFPISSSC
jgi:hypothetical protein